MSIHEKAIRGFGWFFLNTVSTKLLRLVNRLAVAKLLIPDQFGLAVLAITIIGIVDTFRKMGLDDALIVKQEFVETSSNTVFWLVTLSGLISTMIVIVIAPALGVVFQSQELVPVLQVLAIVLTIDSLETVPSTLLSKELEFKKKVVPGVLPPFFYTLVAIMLAAKGFGVWSLIIGQIVASIVSVLGNWSFSSFRPEIEFSMSIAKELTTFGSNITIAAIASMIYQRVDDLVIGMILGPASLAAYTIGYMLGNLPTVAFTKTVTPVLYPTIAAQEQGQRKSLWTNTVKVIGIFSIPAGVGLFTIAPGIISVILGPEYNESVPLIRIITIYGVIRSIAATGGPLLKTSGLTQLYARLMITQALLLVVIVWPLTSAFGTIGTATAILISSLPNNIGQIYYAAQEFEPPITDVGISLISYLFYSIIMAMGVQFINSLFPAPSLLNQFIIIAVGVAIYVAILTLFEYKFLVFCIQLFASSIEN